MAIDIDWPLVDALEGLTITNRRYKPTTTATWTYDLVVDAVAGLAFMGADDIPCDSPYPCNSGDELDGVEYTSDMAYPVTLQPVRIKEYFSRDAANKEAGRYLWGFGCTLDDDGFLIPWFCTVPVSGRQPVVSRGIWFVQDDDDPTQLVDDGMVGIGVSLAAPAWNDGLFSNNPPRCGSAN